MGAQKEWLVSAVIPARVHCTVNAQTAEAAARKARTKWGSEVVWWYDDDTPLSEGTIVVRSVTPYPPVQ
jgi:hypothetical protein